MRTSEDIYLALKRDFYEAGGVSIADGSDMSLRLMAVAAEIYSLEVQCRFMAMQAFPQYASGKYLDNHAGVRALERRQAAKAEGLLRFYAAEPARSEMIVPTGTQCLNGRGSVFETLEQGSIAVGESFCDVAARALLPGEEGNASPDSIVYMRLAPTGIHAVSNPEAFSGGCGEEDDELLRSRVLASYRRLPNGANAAWYESLVLEQEGVEKVVVLPRERGRGTVDIVFSAEGGLPSDELVQQVQQLLHEHREICVDVLVKKPETVTVDISAKLSVESGRDFSSVAAQTEEALRAYFGGHRLGEAVYPAKLLSIIMSVDGVENCILDLPAAETEACGTVLPLPGSISISEAV